MDYLGSRGSHRSRRSKANVRTSLNVRSLTLVAVAALFVGVLAAPSIAQGDDPLPQQTITNIAYNPPVPANTNGNLLDLYLPERQPGERVPLLIWTSGSAWFSDTGKSGANTWANAFRPRGFAVAGVSIRSSSQVKFPGQLHDIKAAIRWLRANADTYGLDSDRFAIAGNSSGGWTAAIAGVTGGVDEDLEGTAGVTGVSSRVQAVVDFYGPTDFQLMDYQEPSIIVHDSPTSPESSLIGCAIQVCPELTQRANPLNYVSEDDPPYLIMHGSVDNLVPMGQSRILYEKMLDLCMDATYHVVPGIGHSHSFVTNTNQALNQTVRKTNGCGETVTQGFEGGTAPNYDYIEAFLHRAFAAMENEPPVTTATLTADEITSQGWHSKAVVTLEAEDSPSWGSGVAETEYRIDGGPWVAYTGPILVDGNGGRTVEYRSIDAAGNEEEPKSLSFVAFRQHATSCKVDGTGTIADSAGAPGSFSLRAQSQSGSNAATGNITFSADGIGIESVQVASVTCTDDPSRATIAGIATLESGAVADVTFDVQDLGSGRFDRFRVVVGTGYDSGDRPLGSGNIAIW